VKELQEIKNGLSPGQILKKSPALSIPYNGFLGGWIRLRQKFYLGSLA
jgi:hypothetical protein